VQLILRVSVEVFAGNSFRVGVLAEAEWSRMQ